MAYTAAAVVSFTAQYRMVDAARHLPVVAAMEAAIPKVSRRCPITRQHLQQFLGIAS